ncbi:MAG: cytochrome c maturation protein CcmE, partial [Rhodospirillaceae bacterium]
NLTFFLSPTEIAEKTVEEGRRIRLGGLVVEGSVQRTGDTVNFAVTDHAHTVQIAYTGILPDLFREGQGIVAEGKLVGNQFQAATVLAKHDEQYMPAEVAEALKASGHWEEGADLKAQ